MSIAPRPGMLRFEGDVAVFYMAICQQCDIALPHPTEMAREMWATAHPHTVTYALDVRPDAGVAERRRYVLVSRLREKYCNAMPSGRTGSCAGHNHHGNPAIFAGQPYVQWDGKLWHAECLDDAAYLRMASITDIIPGVFDGVKPVTMKTWLSGDLTVDEAEQWAKANPSYTVVSDPLARHANLVSAVGLDLKKVIADDVDQQFRDATGYAVVQPKKPNARERRRQRRKGKQWQRGS